MFYVNISECADPSSKEIYKIIPESKQARGHDG